jgi:hypothetical protein
MSEVVSSNNLRILLKSKKNILEYFQDVLSPKLFMDLFF